MSDTSSDYHARPPPPPHSKRYRSRPSFVKQIGSPESSQSSFKYGVPSFLRERYGYHVPGKMAVVSESGVSSNLDGQRRRHRCLMCCAWTFLISFAIAVVILALSFILVATLRAALPQVHVVAFDMPSLKIDTQPDMLLTTVFREQIEFYNKNSDTELRYTGLMVDVSSENVPLGETSLPKFQQNSNNRSIAQVQTTVSQAVINEDDAKELSTQATNGQLVINTVLSGYITFHLGMLKLSNIPFLVVCRNVKQADISFSKHPANCEVQIFKFR